jgi:hypothetical protein
MEDSHLGDADITSRFSVQRLAWEDDNGWHYLGFDVSESRTFKDARKVCRWVKKCVKCSGLSPIRPCRNCGNTQFTGISITGSSSPGISCSRCRLAAARWECKGFRCSNPYDSTLGELYHPICFIATAVLENPLASELTLLRRFRRELERSQTGLLFTRGYDRVSPWLASIVSRSPVARHTARLLVVRPALLLARWLTPGAGNTATDTKRS